MVGTGIFDILARRFTPDTGLKYPPVTSQFDGCQWSHWMLNVECLAQGRRLDGDAAVSCGSACQCG